MINDRCRSDSFSSPWWSGDRRLSKFRFSSVLIDEATQATEPETLIPMVLGARQVIMVGDHKQLGPVITDSSCSKANFGRSMFERLIQSGIKPICLTVQYRMHPIISEFPSNKFYNGSLKNGVTVEERTKICSEFNFTWPNPQVPMYFLSCFGSEELAGTGTSYLNRSHRKSCHQIT